MRRAPSPKRHYEQLFLDLGQTNFTHTTCSVCGLLYAMGVQQDDKVHATFHKAFMEGITFKGWKKERAFRVAGRPDQRIVLILPGDGEVHQRKVREVAAVMEADLGLAEEWLLSKPCKVYLYIAASKVVGCLMVESISQAYKTILLRPPQEAEQRDALLEATPAADVSKGDAFVSTGRVFPGPGAASGVAQGAPGSVLREGSVGGEVSEAIEGHNGREASEKGVQPVEKVGTSAKGGVSTVERAVATADDGLGKARTEPLEEEPVEGFVEDWRRGDSLAGVPEAGLDLQGRDDSTAVFDVTNRGEPGSAREGDRAGAEIGRAFHCRTARAEGGKEGEIGSGERAAREEELDGGNEQTAAFGQPTGTGKPAQHAGESNSFDVSSVGDGHPDFVGECLERRVDPETGPSRRGRQGTGPSSGQSAAAPERYPVAVTQHECPAVDALQQPCQLPSPTPQLSEPLGQPERLQPFTESKFETPKPLPSQQSARPKKPSEGPRALQGRPSLYAQMMSASGRKRVKSEKRTSEVKELTLVGEPQALMCRTEAVRATCGVRAIWVRKAERRKGVATALMDAMRSSFVTGCVLEPSTCAFSQPTPDGRRFAARYCKTDTFLVYQ